MQKKNQISKALYNFIQERKFVKYFGRMTKDKTYLINNIA